MKFLRSAFALAGLAAGCAILIATFILGLFRPNGPLAWLTVRSWAWLVILTGGVEVLRRKGFERVPKSSGAVLMSNHNSLLDPVVIMALSDRPVYFLARHDLFRIPLLGWAMRSNGHIAVKNGECPSADCLAKASARLREQKLVFVYPEGTRSAANDLLPFSKGGFILAMRSKTPIVPIGVANTMAVCPKGWHWAGHAPVGVVVGEPIDTTDYSLADVQVLMQIVRDRIIELRAEATIMKFVSGTETCASL